MNYVIIYILLLPLKGIMRLFYRPTGRSLVIQTAKIGDFINITPMLRALIKSDVLISKTVKPLAEHDETISKIFLIEEAKRNLVTKINLAFSIMNRYDNIYLVQPNSTNLFFSALCNAPNKQFLRTYVLKPYHAIFYRTAKGIVEHRKQDLTIDSYLKLINREYSHTDFPKHATSPLFEPITPPVALLSVHQSLRIGISISAGNRAKTIPAAVWNTLMEAMADLPCTWYVFGPPSEQPYLDELLTLTGNNGNIVNLIGHLTLEEVPWAIEKMDIYIASDSGNVYIADAQNVPVVVLYGPCNVQEQRPTNKVLLIGPNNIPATSFIFSAPYTFNYSADELFKLDDKKIQSIKSFILGIWNSKIK
ncbi:MULTISPECIES: glycosyltransferase family 9 protein [unclassified Pantoea]|uniref:glycosyltransferase family 9 protein n=1 Tax=unclassified Pantoea TaxID=2630326 RepID=UPI00301B9F87